MQLDIIAIICLFLYAITYNIIKEFKIEFYRGPGFESYRDHFQKTLVKMQASKPELMNFNYNPLNIKYLY